MRLRSRCTPLHDIEVICVNITRLICTGVLNAFIILKCPELEVPFLTLTSTQRCNASPGILLRR